MCDDIDWAGAERIDAASDIFVFPFDGIGHRVAASSVPAAIHRMDRKVRFQHGPDRSPTSARRSRAMYQQQVWSEPTGVAGNAGTVT
jgi:hypothetical protein